MEVHGSYCLRSLQGGDFFGGERRFVIDQAMDECSKNKRCLGIEKVEGRFFRKGITLFRACLDSIYASTAWDKYENRTNQLFKKISSHGKYTPLKAPQYLTIKRLVFIPTIN